MQKYIGTKLLNAKPMKLKAATELLRRDIGYKGTLDENDDADGYLAEYPDGYQSWSPFYAFEPAYRPITNMSFGLAIEALKIGKIVCRAGWNGKGMYVFLIQGSNNIASLHGYGFGELLGEPTFRDAMFMKTVDNQLVPWTVSQTDALADDWMIVE